MTNFSGRQPAATPSSTRRNPSAKKAFAAAGACGYRA